MNTNHQITALLHGELTDDNQVGELMHVLAVSPEKRGALLEQIRLSRELLRSGSSLPLSKSTAEGIWSRFNTPEGSAPTIAAAAVGTGTSRERNRSGYLPLLLMLLLGIGGGLLAGLHLASGEADRQVAVVDDTGTPYRSEHSGSLHSTILAEQDASQQEAPVMTSDRNRTAVLEERIAELRQLLERERMMVIVLQGENERLRSGTEEPEERGRMRDGEERDDRMLRPVPERLTAVAPSGHQMQAREDRERIGTVPFAQQSPDRQSSPWRLEMRQFFRSSLPDVQGLDGSGNLMVDREVGASIGLERIGLPTRFGTAVGMTRFSQVYHTNTGGAPNDTIIEQSPALFYGRAYIAPRIFATDRITGTAEIGGGGTELGPVGTIGLGLEYGISDHLRINGGITSWLLWTSFRGQLHTSTNLNGHLGISINP